MLDWNQPILPMPMNLANAIAFLVMGTVMEVLPEAFPGWFPRTGLDGTSARALWLHLMGFVEAGISTAFCVTEFVVPWVAKSMKLAASAGANGRGGFVLTGARSADLH
jgi:hypothetical protein